METIPLYRVQLALGIVADSLREKPFCIYGPELQRCRYALSNPKPISLTHTRFVHGGNLADAKGFA